MSDITERLSRLSKILYSSLSVLSPLIKMSVSLQIGVVAYYTPYIQLPVVPLTQCGGH